MRDREKSAALLIENYYKNYVQVSLKSCILNVQSSSQCVKFSYAFALDET